MAAATRSHLDAYDTAPRVSLIEDEIIVSGDGVCAVYTVDAAEELIARLRSAVDVAGSAGRLVN